MLAWVFFRSESLGEAMAVIQRLFTGWGEPNVLLAPLPLAAVLMVMASQFTPQTVLDGVEDRYAVMSPVLQGAILGIAGFLVFALGPDGPSEFIYSGF